MTGTTLAPPDPTASGPTDGDDPRPVTVRFDGVGKCFDDRWIVRDLDVEVTAGTILGMVGPSGCGKTTTVRLATGVYRPDAGEVVVLGSDPTARRTAERTAIGYLPQSPVLFDDLSLWENLNFHASLNGVPWRRRERLHELLELVHLDGEERKLIHDASGGMRRRLALAATLVHDPPLLILDEPTAGIDPLLRREIWDHFRSLRDEGHTVVVTTQHVNEAAHCDVVVVLVEGRVVAVGTPEELHRRAFGGDVATIRFASVVDDQVRTELDSAGPIAVDLTGPFSVRVVVEQASTDLPALLRRLEERGITVEESSEVPVDWDETFIALVGADEQP